MRQYPSDIRITLHHTVVNKIYSRSSSLEGVFQKSWRKLQWRWVRRPCGVNEGGDRAAVHFGIEFIKNLISDVDAILTGKKREPIRMKGVKRVIHLLQRSVNIGERQNCVEAKVSRKFGREDGDCIISSLRQIAGLRIIRYV